MTRAHDRQELSTARVATKFGSIYGMVEHVNGRVTGVHIAHPQKHEDSAVGEALEALGAAITQAIEEINARWPA